MDPKTSQPQPSATEDDSRRDTVMGDAPAPPPQPFQRSTYTSNPFVSAIRADIRDVPGLVAKYSEDLERDLALLPFLQRLEVLGVRLGKMKDNKWTTVCSSTVLAMLDIKALIAKPSLPDFLLRVFDGQYRSHLQNLAWRFNDAFEMINFMSAHGRNNPLFAKKGVAYINIPVPANSDGACCRVPNRETQARHCEMEDCLICEGTSLFPGILPSTTEFDDGLIQDFDRPPCGHAQLDRMLSLIAARLPSRGYYNEATLYKTISRLRRELMDAWKERQVRHGWQFTSDAHWPPDNQNTPLIFNTEEKIQIAVRCALTYHKDDGYVVHWSFVGQWGLLV